MVWFTEELLFNIFLDLDNNTWKSIKDKSPKEVFESLSKDQQQPFLDANDLTLGWAFQQRDDENKKTELCLALENTRIKE